MPTKNRLRLAVSVVYLCALAIGIYANLRFWASWHFGIPQWRMEHAGLWMAGVLVLMPILFVMSIGTNELRRRVGEPRRIIPTLIAAYALTGVVWGASIAAGEMFQSPALLNEDLPMVIVLVSAGLIVAGLGFVVSARWSRYQIVRRFGLVLVVAGTAELLLAVFSFGVVSVGLPSEFPQIFMGESPGGGVLAGINVLLGAVGPMLVFWLLRPRYDAERAANIPYCPVCEYDLRASRERCPECAAPITPASSPAP